MSKKIKRTPSKTVKARDRLKLKAPPIKLFLHEKKDFREAIRYILDNEYHWKPFNIQEIKTYIIDLKLKLNPVTIEVIEKETQYVHWERLINNYIFLSSRWDVRTKLEKAKDFHKAIGKEWNNPEYILYLEKLIMLWELSKGKYLETRIWIKGKPKPKRMNLRDKYLTIKEWFPEVDLPFPPELEPVSNQVITNEKDLRRIGIFEALDLKIKESLGIEDEIEYAVHNWDRLEPLEKDHIKILFATKAISKKHPYYIFIKEYIEQE